MKKATSTKGFTLIELLVIIAIIELLLAIIIPSLKATKEAGMRAVCISNFKGLSLAFNVTFSPNFQRLQPDNPDLIRCIKGVCGGVGWAAGTY